MKLIAVAEEQINAGDAVILEETDGATIVRRARATDDLSDIENLRITSRDN